MQALEELLGVLGWSAMAMLASGWRLSRRSLMRGEKYLIVVLLVIMSILAATTMVCTFRATSLDEFVAASGQGSVSAAALSVGLGSSASISTSLWQASTTGLFTVGTSGPVALAGTTTGASASASSTVTTTSSTTTTTTTSTVTTSGSSSGSPAAAMMKVAAARTAAVNDDDDDGSLTAEEAAAISIATRQTTSSIARLLTQLAINCDAVDGVSESLEYFMGLVCFVLFNIQTWWIWRALGKASLRYVDATTGGNHGEEGAGGYGDTGEAGGGAANNKLQQPLQQPLDPAVRSYRYRLLRRLGIYSVAAVAPWVLDSVQRADLKAQQRAARLSRAAVDLGDVGATEEHLVAQAAAAASARQYVLRTFGRHFASQQQQDGCDVKFGLSGLSTNAAGDDPANSRCLRRMRSTGVKRTLRNPGGSGDSGAFSCCHRTCRSVAKFFRRSWRYVRLWYLEMRATAAPRCRTWSLACVDSIHLDRIVFCFWRCCRCCLCAKNGRSSGSTRSASRSNDGDFIARGSNVVTTTTSSRVSSPNAATPPAPLLSPSASRSTLVASPPFDRGAGAGSTSGPHEQNVLGFVSNDNDDPVGEFSSPTSSSGEDDAYFNRARRTLDHVLLRARRHERHQRQRAAMLSTMSGAGAGVVGPLSSSAPNAGSALGGGAGGATSATQLHHRQPHLALCTSDYAYRLSCFQWPFLLWVVSPFIKSVAVTASGWVAGQLTMMVVIDYAGAVYITGLILFWFAL
jgi:hypothetical protein